MSRSAFGSRRASANSKSSAGSRGVVRLRANSLIRKQRRRLRGRPAGVSTGIRSGQQTNGEGWPQRHELAGLILRTCRAILRLHRRRRSLDRGQRPKSRSRLRTFYGEKRPTLCENLHHPHETHNPLSISRSQLRCFSIRVERIARNPTVANLALRFHISLDPLRPVVLQRTGPSRSPLETGTQQSIKRATWWTGGACPA
jgi:hypothetical protein